MTSGISENEVKSKPHKLSIVMGRTIVPYDAVKGAWALPHNRRDPESSRWVYTRRQAHMYAVVIAKLTEGLNR
jgi:hypothetical protein